MSDRCMTLAEIAEEKVIPFSEKTLGRMARAGEGPFFKVRSRWVAYKSDAEDFMRSHRPRRSGPDLDPMPVPRQRRSSFRQKVVELDARRA